MEYTEICERGESPRGAQAPSHPASNTAPRDLIRKSIIPAEAKPTKLSVNRTQNPVGARLFSIGSGNLRAGVFQGLRGGLKGLDFLGPEFQLDVLEHTGAADDGRHADRNSTNAVGSMDLA